MPNGDVSNVFSSGRKRRGLLTSSLCISLFLTLALDASAAEASAPPPVASDSQSAIATPETAAPKVAPPKMTESSEATENTNPNETAETEAALPETVAPPQLKLTIQAAGGKSPWLLRLKNDDQRIVTVSLDTRLLRLELNYEENGKAIKAECLLPSEMLPSKAEAAALRRMKPGEEAIRLFDPRFYCFNLKDRKHLREGATLTAHLGYEPASKTFWAKGAKQKELLDPQPPPFLAWPEQDAERAYTDGAPALPHSSAESAKTNNNAPPDSSTDFSESTLDEEEQPFTQPSIEIANRVQQLIEFAEDLVAPPPVRKIPELTEKQGGLKEIQSEATPITADDLNFAQLTDNDPDSPIIIDLAGNVDAHSERDANVTVRIKNRSKSSIRIFARREHILFKVRGPSGEVDCIDRNDERPGDRGAFQLLGAGSTLSYPTRLIEFCPRGTFKRPGLYLIGAKLRTTDDGSDFKYEAYVGHTEVEEPIALRVRTGVDPYLLRRPNMHRGSSSGGSGDGANNHMDNTPTESQGSGEGEAQAVEMVE